MCLTLGHPVNYNLPGSSLHGILQARILEWIRFPFSSPGDLHNPGIEPGSPVLQADSLLSEPSRKPLSIANSAVLHCSHLPSSAEAYPECQFHLAWKHPEPEVPGSLHSCHPGLMANECLMQESESPALLPSPRTNCSIV